MARKPGNRHDVRNLPPFGQYHADQLEISAVQMTTSTAPHQAATGGILPVRSQMKGRIMTGVVEDRIVTVATLPNKIILLRQNIFSVILIIN